jgi:tetratricopeptide (TPR) repeat protein
MEAQMKHKVYVGMLIFSICCALLIGEETKTIDQEIAGLEKELQRVSGREKVDVLNKLAYSYTSKSAKKCLEYAGQALALSQKINDPAGEAFALNNSGIGHAISGNTQKALACFQQSLQLYKKINDDKGSARALTNIGSIHRRKGDSRKALAVYREVLEIQGEAGLKRETAATLSNIGNAYKSLDDSTRALDHYLKSLKIREELGDKKGTATLNHNIGVLYLDMKKTATALEFFKKALADSQAVGNKAGVSATLSCIGLVYQELKDYPSALDYFKQALKMAEEIGNKDAASYFSGNIGGVYEAMNDDHSALRYYQKASQINNEIGNKWGIGMSFIAIGKIHIKSRDYDTALDKIQRGLKIAEEMNSKDLAVRGYKSLSQLYAAKGDYKKALEYYQRFDQTDNQVLSEKSTKQINELHARYQSEKKEKEIEMLKKNNEIKDLKIEKATVTRNALIIGFILVVTILATLFKQYLYLFAFWKRQKYIGQFRLMEKVASGSTGTVFKARITTGKPRIAAVKILRGELFNDEIIKKRFKRESAIIDTLEHPNIVKIIERGESGPQLFTAMEFLEGKTLENHIKTHGTPHPKTSVHIMLQIARAVDYIHGKNIIHRDLKPSNIMLTHKNGDPYFVKLLDFGLARMENETRLTHSGNFLGTIEYVAPEQILNGDSSPANDIFSMGVTFYFILSGRTPFPGATITDIMQKIIGETPEGLLKSRPEFPVELNRLVMEMMHKQPDRRPSAAAIQRELRDIHFN